MEPVTQFCSYIASRCPVDCANLLKSQGYDIQSNSHDYLTNNLVAYIHSDKEDAIRNIVKIHPDKKMFETYCVSVSKNDLHADKCAGGDCGAEGDKNIISPAKGMSEKTLNTTIIVGGVAITMIILGALFAPRVIKMVN
jgi:hypothetical protein